MSPSTFHRDHSDTDCSEILELMERTALAEETNGVVDELAARRVEQHLLECDQCQSLLERDDWGDALPEIPLPSAAQWAELDRHVLERPRDRIAIAGSRVSGPLVASAPLTAEREDSRLDSPVPMNAWGSTSERVPWQSRGLAAAALLLLCLLGLQGLRSTQNGDAPVDFPEFAFESETAVEVIEAPEDVDVIVQTFAEESDGAIVIFVSS